MKFKPITLTILCTVLFTQPVAADDLSELKAQLKVMQQQMQAMQIKLNAQDAALKKQEQVSNELKHQQASGHTGEMSTMGRSIGNSMTIGGAIEIKSHHSDSKNWTGESESDIVLDTFEMSVDTTAGDWASGHVLFLYEQDPGPGRDADNLQVDEAYITFANSDVTPIYVTAGRIYVPFGNFESNMISDPATLTLAETRNEVVQLGFETQSGFYGSAYIFNGDIPEAKSGLSGKENTHIDNYGLNFGYSMENDDLNLDIGAGYISNIAAAGGIYDAMKGNNACDGDDCIKDYVGGISFYAIANIGAFNLIGEYISATDDFAVTDFSGSASRGQKLRPEAWNVEGAYNFTMLGKDAAIALGYQKTKDFYLDDESTAYFEKAWLTSISVEILESTTLAAEWRHADGYSEVKNMPGKASDDEDLLQVKLSYEF